jgi:hypothetical protein
LDKKERNHLWYEKNKEEILRKHKEYIFRHKQQVSEYSKKYWKENKERLIEQRKEYQERNREKFKVYQKHFRQKLRLRCLVHYGGNPPKCSCPNCNESHIEFLTIDHIKGGGNKHAKLRKDGNLYQWLSTNDFPEGFRVLCYNCNCSIGHYGYCPHQKRKEGTLH